MKRLWRNNGLSIVLFLLFATFLGGQTVTGWQEENEQRQMHQEPPATLVQYVASGSFVEATTENWESEFLQMFAYVLFTVFLFQRGSSESKAPDEASDSEAAAPAPDIRREGMPGPVRARSGWRRRLYENSLSLAFFFLFAVSFVLHAIGGAEAFSEERASHNEAAVSAWEYLHTSRFWFESFQNWQSEFLAIWAMVVLSIFLRQKGSPESKPVDAPNSQTGTE